MGLLRGLWAATLSLAMVGLMAWSSQARAHIGAAEGLMPFVADDVLLGAGTTRGLISPSNGANGFAQSCEESVGALPRAFVQLAADDANDTVTMVASDLGLATTIDSGCTWTPVSGTEDRDIAALAASTTTGALWAAANVDPDAPEEVGNALLVSRDRGQTFAIAYAVGGEVRLTSLAVGSLDVVGEVGDRLLVAGIDVDTLAPVLWVASTNSGELAPLIAVAAEVDAQLVRALAIDEDGLWFSTLDSIGRGHLWRAVIDDAGAGSIVAVEVASFDGVVRATARIAGYRFAVAASGVLHRAPVNDLAAFSRTTDGPLQCLLRVPGDERLWGCGAQAAGTFFRATRDGETWVDVLPFDTVDEMVCPSTTPAAAACAYRFDVAEPEPLSPPPAPPSKRAEPSCGQAAAGQPLGDCALVAVFALLTRARRARTTAVPPTT